jgi:hypothetical protein
MNPVNFLKSYYFNLTLLSVPESSRGFFPSGFVTNILYAYLFLPCVHAAVHEHEECPCIIISCGGRYILHVLGCISQ